MRLIDADTLIAACKKIAKIDWNKRTAPVSWSDAYEGFIDTVEEIPTIDAVPVVRCAECKHWKKGNFQGGDSLDRMEWGGGCPLVHFVRYESDFCSKGERRSDD